MVMHKTELDALTKVRAAIVECAVEDIGMVDDLAPTTRDLVNAWNEFVASGVHGRSYITGDDYDG